MALVFELKSRKHGIPVVIDGVEYTAKTVRVEQMKRLSKAMLAVGSIDGETAQEKLERIEAAEPEIESLVREVFTTMFGAEAAAQIVGDDRLDIVESAALCNIAVGVTSSPEYLELLGSMYARSAATADRA